MLVILSQPQCIKCDTRNGNKTEKQPYEIVCGDLYVWCISVKYIPINNLQYFV